MDKALSNEAVALLANSIKDLPIEDVTAISNRVASVYGEPARERLVSAVIAKVHERT